jgi:predicted TIM-barrel fold metal-dependent hydrolase
VPEAKLNRSQRIHQELDHPIVDADGHWVESSAVLRDYVAELGGEEVAKRFEASPIVQYFDDTGAGADPSLPMDVRRDRWVNRSLFWGFSTRNTLDRATSHLPGLLAERLDEMGIDVSLLYGSLGIHLPRIEDTELRQISCRAYNTYAMEETSAYRDRLIPVATIPMDTPDEALAALEHAVGDLGYRAVVFQQYASRPIPMFAREHPELGGFAARPDYYGLDSAYDYDPVWAKCVELKVAATFHAIGAGRAGILPGSVTNQIFNRAGMFAAVHHRLATALVVGGVTRRFPELNLAFLEGGVGWASSLYAELLGLWDKRNVEALARLDPANLDRRLFFELIDKYGSPAQAAHSADTRALLTREFTRPEDLNEFALMDVSNAEGLADLFTERLYFGCEGDDAMNSLAFNARLLPFGRSLNAFYGSDISHWDVPDMSECLHEAFESVEDGIMDRDEFRRLMFENPVRLHAQQNPDFFVGTRVEKSVATLLSS